MFNTNNHVDYVIVIVCTHLFTTPTITKQIFPGIPILRKCFLTKCSWRFILYLHYIRS